MTREELNKLIMQACERTWNEKTCKEIEQALSQEPYTDAVPLSVIEDIKAEIQDKQWFFAPVIVNHVIAIIDKHIKEQTEWQKNHI